MVEFNIQKLMVQARENNNPKREFNHIFVDSENFVVTDTRVLIVYKHNMEVEGKSLLLNPKCKADMEWNKEDGFMEFGTEVFRKKKLLDPGEYEGMVFSYPDYKRLLPTSKPLFFNIGRTTKEHIKGCDALYYITHKHGVVLDYVRYATLIKKMGSIWFDRYYFTNINMPVTIENDDIKIVIMPLVF